MLFSEMFDRIDELDVREQAICEWEAAKECLPIWERREAMMEKHGKARSLCCAFEAWCAGSVSAEQLRLQAEEFNRLLPEDLSKEVDPTTGMAGCAIYGATMAGVDEDCEVRHSLLRTDVLYAAAAACNSGRCPDPNGDDVTPKEAAFLQSWWAGCCERVATLRKG